MDVSNPSKISTRNKPFGLAQVYQIKGFVYAQMNQFKNAETYLRKALELNAMPKRGTLSTMMTLAQIQMAQEKFAKAVPLIQDFIFNSENPNARHYVALAQCFAALKLYQAGVKPLRTAIRMEPKPRETWYQLLVALEYQSKNYRGAIDGLTVLVKLKPNKEKYWRQLSTIYMANNRKVEALAAMEISYKKGFLDKEKEILHLISLYYDQGVPWKAAKIMEDSIQKGLVKKTQKNLELVSSLWSESRDVDKALEFLALAAPIAKNGQVYVRQGTLFLEKENWEEASKSLVKGIAKGKLRKPGFAYLSLGISQYNQAQYSNARGSFEKAMATEYSKRQAEQWIAHLESEGR